MFKKIKNYFKGLFVNKRQETLLKTIHVWEEVKKSQDFNPLEIDMMLMPEPGFSEARLTPTEDKIVG